MYSISLEKISESKVLDIARKAIAKPVEAVRVRDITTNREFVELEAYIFFDDKLLNREIQVEDLQSIRKAVTNYIQDVYPQEYPFVHFRFQPVTSLHKPLA